MNTRQRLERTRRLEAAILEGWIREGTRPEPTILEVGAGLGHDTRWLSKIGPTVAIDPFAKAPAPIPNAERLDCGADCIPKPDDTFDVCFSTSVLEHLDDLPAVFRELRRVCKPDALHVHVMPTHHWKTLAIGTHLIRTGYLALRGAGKESSAENVAAWRRQAGLRKSSRWIPEIHGTAASNRAEWLEFHPRTWIKRLRSLGMDLESTRPLLLYPPPELPGPWVTRLPEFLGIASCYAFIGRLR